MEESSSKSESPKNEAKEEFKKPVLVGRVGKLPKKTSSNTEQSIEQQNTQNHEDKEASDDGPKNNLPPAVLLKELSTPIPYKEPKWSGLCPDGSDYALEVLKSGMILERIELTKKPYYVFGRLANCDVVMAHPTISRHHAVLQYKAFAEDGEPPSGWYLYELGSTHGTFLNKDRVKPATYTRVRVGHQIKFGNSTRFYIVLGPDFDCEGESELTVTEIKARAQVMKKERDRMIQEAIEQRERDKLEEERKREEQGIDWGMGEDAEEEPDLAENPYAITTNEELYLDDPKKTLRGYFEREGHELSYQCDEKGMGQFLCRVELPIDDARGNPVIAEVLHKGKKKEAVVACALEACRILDRVGLLRQAKHESRRRKERDWSADDYYDSDDDTFLDRTGSVERKRTLRMQRHGATDTQTAEDKPLTYDDLLKTISEIKAKIAMEEKSLERLRSANKQAASGSETDDLDAYMDSLGKQGQSMAHKAEISKTKMSIQKLKAELSKTVRLSDLARPAHVPPLVKQDNKMAVKVANSVVYGKRIRLKDDAEKRPKPRQVKKEEDGEFVEEMDSDEEAESSRTTEKSSRTTEESSRTTEASSRTTEESSRTNEEPKSKSSETSKNIPKSIENDSNSLKSEANIISKENNDEVKKMYGPMRPPENYEIPEGYFDQVSDRDLPEIMEKE